jgi:hypothetical protein
MGLAGYRMTNHECNEDITEEVGVIRISISYAKSFGNN